MLVYQCNMDIVFCVVLSIFVFVVILVHNLLYFIAFEGVGRLGYPGGRRLASMTPPKSDATSSSPDVVIGVLGMAIKPFKLS